MLLIFGQFKIFQGEFPPNKEYRVILKSLDIDPWAMMIGILAGTLGWQGVLVSLVIVSAMGTIAVYRAAALDQRQRNNQSLIT